ncbi:hypothetical protein QBC34DRAFT_95766 [Podospora aff. communis PSN243]|uniref:Secreted protein n=1 Tax=Podospora aff. communis PSN243 TaxID=3040156 RepID=A0AAV9GM89_9PEZI|nr:hypothetical protein QBC34DRAFT_95766 [Podospora aff. communis PSN243]
MHRSSHPGRCWQRLVLFLPSLLHSFWGGLTCWVVSAGERVRPKWKPRFAATMGQRRLRRRKEPSCQRDAVSAERWTIHPGNLWTSRSADWPRFGRFSREKTKNEHLLQSHDCASFTSTAYEDSGEGGRFFCGQVGDPFPSIDGLPNSPPRVPTASRASSPAWKLARRHHLFPPLSFVPSRPILPSQPIEASLGGPCIASRHG